jgi:hypothetical protein
VTPLELSRWRDFAVRMARSHFARLRRPPGEWVLEMVVEFFDQLEANVSCGNVDLA